jgi:hypothetical protein
VQHSTPEYVLQSLPDGFATTLRERILTAGTFVDNPYDRHDTTCRQLGRLVATTRSTTIYDGRRDILLVAERDFMSAMQHLDTTITNDNTLQ